MVNTVVNAGLGMVFWAIAGRLFSPADLGIAAALISAMVLLSTVSQLNLGSGMARLLPQVTERRWRPVAGAYALTGIVGVIVTLAFVGLAPLLSEGFAFLTGNLPLTAALVGAVVLWNVFALQDAVLTSARWSAVVPVENAIFGLLKIGLLFWLVNTGLREGVFYAWLIGMAALLIPVNGLIFGRALRSPQPAVTSRDDSLSLADRGKVVRYLAGDYGAALLSQGSKNLLPLLVVAVLGREANAFFYVAFLVASGLGTLADALSTSLLAEASQAGAELGPLARRSAARFCKFVLPAGVALAAAAPLVLFPFGPEYVERGATLLRLLVAGVLIHGVIVLFFAMERIRGHVARIVWGEAVIFVLVAGGAVVGMRVDGLRGLGLAWLAAQTVMAAVVGPATLRRLFPRTGSQPSTKPDDPTGRTQPRASSRLDQITLVDAGAAAVSGGLLVFLATDAGGPIRILLALAFVTLVPGWALQRMIPMTEASSALGLAVALSLAVAVVVTLAALWASVWDPRLIGEVLAGLCLAALLWRLARPRALSP